MVQALRNIVAAVLLVSLAASAAGGLWLDVPFVPQEKNGCGAAVIAMLMRYWAPAKAAKVDPAAIHRELYSPKAGGVFASDLTGFLEKQGYRTFVVQGTWRDLRSHLEKGRPLVVALGRLAGSDSLHYVVVSGMDWHNGLVLLNDPAADRKLRKMERRQFEEAWKSTGHWLLLATPTQR